MSSISQRPWSFATSASPFTSDRVYPLPPAEGPKSHGLKGYRLYSAASTLGRIASLMSRGIGIVFVFWDIHTTSRLCRCANSKLSIEVIGSRYGRDGSRGSGGVRDH